MTGDVNVDAILTIVAALAIFLGGAFGWPWLVRLGQRLRGEEETVPPAPVDPAALLPMALRDNPKGASWLLVLLPLLQPLIQAIIDALTRRLGRKPTEEEVQAEVGRRLFKVEVPAKELPPEDLERTIGGASKVNGLVSHAHQTMRSANESMARIDAAVAEAQGLLRQ